jgi:hypothetical protein
MQVIIQRRAEIAMRSLDLRDRDDVNRALNQLKEWDFRQLLAAGKVHKLPQAPGAAMYVMRATYQLRLVLSFRDETVTVEDVVPHDRLGRLPSAWR